MKKAAFILATLFAFLIFIVACTSDSTSGPANPNPPDTTGKNSSVLQVSSFAPGNGAVGVELNAQLVVRFNHAVVLSSLTDSTVKLSDSLGHAIHLTFAENAAGDSVIVTRKDSLLASTAYTLLIQGGSKGVLDAAGKGMALNFTSTFITRVELQRTGLALMKWSDIASKLVGTFSFPSSNGGNIGVDNNFVYSSGIHAQLANGDLIVTGHPYINKEAEIQLPATLNGGLAQVVGSWSDVTGGLHPAGWGVVDPGGDTGNSYVLGGLLQIGTRIYFTKNQWYNANGIDWGSLGYQEAGVSKGMWQVAGAWAHNQRVGGYMSYAPNGMTAAGYSLLAGLEGGSGAATGRWGPNLFAVQGTFPASVNDSLASKPLLVHPDETKQFPGWWIGDKVSSVVWIETKTQQAVLVFLYQQLGGVTWYGEPTDNVGDPYPSYKGFHAGGYRLEVWIYDPDVLYAVFNGKQDPWTVLPAEKVDLITRAPGSATETVNSFITGNALQSLQASYRNGRLVILQPDAVKYGDYETDPKGFVLQLE